eukprot:35750-Eustigmatos_ZCMA.PRE.1
MPCGALATFAGSTLTRSSCGYSIREGGCFMSEFVYCPCRWWGADPSARAWTRVGLGTTSTTWRVGCRLSNVVFEDTEAAQSCACQVFLPLTFNASTNTILRRRKDVVAEPVRCVCVPSSVTVT